MALKYVPESLLALILPVALLLVSCGGGGGTATAPATPGTTTTPSAFVAAAQTTTVGTSGGSVNLTATDGTLYTFTVPAGALAKDTALSLTTVEPNDGQRFRVVAGPDGLVFQAGLPATLTIRLPAGRELPTTGGLIYNGTPVPSTRNADGSIALLLYQLNGSATPVAALARTAQAAQRRVQAANVAGSGLVCRNPSVNGGPQAGTASYDEIALARYVECVTGQMEDLIDANDFPGAIRLAMSLDDLLQRANVDMPNFLGAASSLMCRGRQRALDTLVSITITDLDDLKVIQAVAYWDMFAQKIGHVCPGQPDLNTAVQPKIDDALTLLDVDPDNITTADVGSSAYISARAMAERSLKLRHELVAIARALGRPVTSPIAQAQAAAAGNAPKARANAAVPGNGYIAEALADAQLQGRLEPAVLKNLLPSPWQRCRSANDFVPLMALVDLYGALDALKAAAQYCGTQLSVESLDNQYQATDSVSGLGGVAAGQTRTSASIQATVDGVLRLAGPISALGCPAGVASNEALVVRFAGVEALRLNTAPYLANNVSLNISQLRAAAGLAASNLSAQPLTIERSGEACAGAWGAAPAPLIAVTVSAGITCPDGQVLKNGQCVERLTRWIGEYLDFYDNPVRVIFNVPSLAVLDIVRSSTSDDDILLSLYYSNGNVGIKLRIRGTMTGTSLQGQVVSGESCGFYNCSNTDYYTGNQIAWTIGSDGVLSGTLFQSFEPNFPVGLDCPPQGGDCTTITRPTTRYWQFQFRR